MKTVMCSKCKQRPAMIFISRVEGDKTTPEGLCLKCAMEANIGPIKQMMQSMGLTEDDVDAVSEQFAGMMDENEDFELGGVPTFPLQNLFGGNIDMSMLKDEDAALADDADDAEQAQTKNKETKPKKKKDKKKPKRKYLDTYCTNLTQRAKDGKIDEIIGRDKEIYRVVQILCRRTKNNPCLIGEPGVGKTAIAEGLALRVAKGEVPAKLVDKEIHLLDLTALVAGTQFRGQFESRIKGLVEEVKANGNIILFIDEVHNLVGTGDAEGSMNAANILKPALSRGEIQVIGATTFNEYRKHIEKDAALERRFQPVKVDEPSIEETYLMLLGIKKYYEGYHRVQISDSLVKQAVVLSERYINDRFLPDKAIDLLDEACTCANLRNKYISEYEINTNRIKELEEEQADLESDSENLDYEQIAKVKSELVVLEGKSDELKQAASDNAVTQDDLASVIHLWTGIPASKVIENDLHRLAELETELKKKIIGQDEAVELVSAAVRRSRVQINPRRHPASFIFVGPTGVGKTELVKQLAGLLFETPETLIRLDMSEFMEKHSVSRIIGSPPGYVGYDEAGQLTEKVRRKPYSVLLFDEIEKAHPDVMNILLQILDEGRITDAQGRTVNFENTVIIMTSNAGSEKKDGSLGFAKSVGDMSREKVMKALSEFLRPEFIGRVDEVVVFRPLEKDDYVKIAELLLNELVEPLSDKGIKFTWTDEVKQKLAEKTVGANKGARELRNNIRKEIEDKIASAMVENWDRKIISVKADVKDDNFKVDIRFAR